MERKSSVIKMYIMTFSFKITEKIDNAVDTKSINEITLQTRERVYNEVSNVRDSYEWSR